MKVRFVGYGILINENNETFICDYDGHGNVMSDETGVLYKITRRDKNENPIEIEEI